MPVVVRSGDGRESPRRRYAGYAVDSGAGPSMRVLCGSGFDPVRLSRVSRRKLPGSSERPRWTDHESSHDEQDVHYVSKV
jgi:hypothetical protein